MTITKEAMDYLVAGGCIDPDCTNPNYGGTLFIHLKCHMGKSTRIEVGVGELRVCCSMCDTNMKFSTVKAKVEGNFSTKGVVVQDCHPKAGIWASYKLGSSKLKLECAKCKQTVGHATLVSTEPKVLTSWLDC